MGNTVSINALAEMAVEAVLKDLHGRRGIGDSLDEIDDDIYKDIKIELAVKVKRAFQASASGAEYEE